MWPCFNLRLLTSEYKLLPSDSNHLCHFLVTVAPEMRHYYQREMRRCSLRIPGTTGQSHCMFGCVFVGAVRNICVCLYISVRMKLKTQEKICENQLFFHLNAVIINQKKLATYNVARKFVFKVIQNWKRYRIEKERDKNSWKKGQTDQLQREQC